MTHSVGRKRQPRGTTTGGQFAVEGKNESHVSLSSGAGDFTPSDRGGGEFDFVSVRIREERSPDDIVEIRMRASGFAEEMSYAGLMGQSYNTGDPDRHMDALVEIAGKKNPQATILVQTSSHIKAREGSVINHEGRLFFKFKGSRNQGWDISSGHSTGEVRVLDVEPGYGKVGNLTRRWNEHANDVPAITAAHLDGIPFDDEGDNSDIAAVFAFNHPGFGYGEDGRGSLFFATDITPDGDDPIVNGFLAVAGRSGMTSEHGSFRFSQFQKAGRVDGYTPGSHSFSDLLKNVNSYDDADNEQYRELVRSVAHACE